MKRFSYIAYILAGCSLLWVGTDYGMVTELFTKIGPKKTVNEFISKLGTELEEKFGLESGEEAAKKIMYGMGFKGGEPFTESMAKSLGEGLDKEVFKGGNLAVVLRSDIVDTLIEEARPELLKNFSSPNGFSKIDEPALESLFGKDAANNVFKENPYKAKKPFQALTGKLKEVTIENLPKEYVQARELFADAENKLAAANHDLKYAKKFSPQDKKLLAQYQESFLKAQNKYLQEFDNFSKQIDSVIKQQETFAADTEHTLLQESKLQEASNLENKIQKTVNIERDALLEKAQLEQSSVAKDVLEQEFKPEEKKALQEAEDTLAVFQIWDDIQKNKRPIVEGLRDINGKTVFEIETDIRNANRMSSDIESIFEEYQTKLEASASIEEKNKLYFATLEKLKNTNAKGFVPEFLKLPDGTKIASFSELAQTDFVQKITDVNKDIAFYKDLPKERATGLDAALKRFEQQSSDVFDDASLYLKNKIVKNKELLAGAALILGAGGIEAYENLEEEEFVVGNYTLILPEGWGLLGIYIYQIKKALAGGADDYVIALKKMSDGTLALVQYPHKDVYQYMSLVTSRVYDGNMLPWKAPTHAQVTYGIKADGTLLFSEKDAQDLAKKIQAPALQGVTDEFTMYLDADINPIDMRKLGSDVMKKRSRIVLTKILPFYAGTAYPEMAKLPNFVTTRIDAAWKTWKQAYKSNEQEPTPQPPVITPAPELDVTVQELLDTPEVPPIPGMMSRHLRQAKNGKYYQLLPENPRDTDALAITTYNATSQPQDSHKGYVYQVAPAQAAQRVATSAQGYAVVGKALELLRAQAGITVAADGKQRLGAGFESPNISAEKNLIPLGSTDESTLRAAIKKNVQSLQLTPEQEEIRVRAALASSNAVAQAQKAGLVMTTIANAGGSYKQSKATLQKFYFDSATGLFLVKIVDGSDTYLIDLHTGYAYDVTGHARVRPMLLGSSQKIANRVLVNSKDPNNIALLETDAKGLKRLDFELPSVKGSVSAVASSIANRTVSQVSGNKTIYYNEYALFAVAYDTETKASAMLSITLKESPVTPIAQDTYVPDATTLYTISEKIGDEFTDMGTYAYDAHKMFAPLHYYATRVGGNDQGFVPDDALRVNPTVFIWNGGDKRQFTQLHYQQQLVPLSTSDGVTYTGTLYGLELHEDETGVDRLVVDTSKTRQITITQKTITLPAGLTEDIVTITDGGKEYDFRYATQVLPDITSFVRTVVRLAPVADARGITRLAYVITDKQIGPQVTAADVHNNKDGVVSKAFDTAVIVKTTNNMHLLYVIEQDDLNGAFVGFKMDMATGIIYDAFGVPFAAVTMPMLITILTKLGVRVERDAQSKQPYLVYAA